MIKSVIPERGRGHVSMHCVPRRMTHHCCAATLDVHELVAPGAPEGHRHALLARPSTTESAERSYMSCLGTRLRQLSGGASAQHASDCSISPVTSMSLGEHPPPQESRPQVPLVSTTVLSRRSMTTVLLGLSVGSTYCRSLRRCACTAHSLGHRH